VESHQPVTLLSCGSIKVFLETITIFLGFDSFVDDAVVGEQSELAGFQIFWGITLQSDLKWTQHINDIVANANKSLGFLKRNLKTSNTNIKSQAYLSLVRPKLEYACSVWDPHTAEHCNKIEMVQRQAARYARMRTCTDL
jgi:hypothetical protein